MGQRLLIRAHPCLSVVHFFMDILFELADHFLQYRHRLWETR
jgi:hypothetical protein